MLDTPEHHPAAFSAAVAALAREHETALPTYGAAMSCAVQDFAFSCFVLQFVLCVTFVRSFVRALVL